MHPAKSDSRKSGVKIVMPPPFGLSIRGASPINNNNSNANTPLPEGHTIHPLFSSNEHQYRSHAFLIKNPRGNTVSFKKTANRNRGPIYNETRKEIRIYDRLKRNPHWREYILPLKEGRVREKRVTLEFNYVSGGDLISFYRRFIEDLGDADVTPSNVSVFFKIFADVARALNFLYENRVAHGDLKPDNIYIANAREPHALLFDFGQSLIEGSDRDDFDKLLNADLRRYFTIVCEGILIESLELDKRYVTDLIEILEKIEGRSEQYMAAAAYWDGLYEEYRLRRAPGNSPGVSRASGSPRATRRISRAPGNSPRPGRVPNHVVINMP
jgi:serine/threonine protein kinase